MVEVVKTAKVLKAQGLFLLRSAIAVTIAIALVLFMGVPRATADDNPLGPNVGTAFLNALGLNPTGGQYDNTLPFSGPSQGADPTKIMNGVMGVGQTALGALGIGGGSAAGAGRPLVYGRAAVERVIQRGGTQLGVPYSWGGGTVRGPSGGVDYDSGKVGFDCSGFTMFSYAAAGVKLPKYSGDQYNSGQKVPVSQAKRGDLLFYGPGGSQHVVIYLGNGQMLEASGSAAKVTVSPVRTGGMTPYAVRIIAW
ncbi:invasion protein [Mycobacteroides franklinii]|uniref:Invasion protein n=1 Tax=Mycobacteroides franklinii TaxID=948102 RepID=A0A1S1L841_9MYCO|nr:NlpC/P60 family protein [Mycobacteroides franklinii]OHU18968.1 invasion protein [Mycobacteroides franklinii]